MADRPFVPWAGRVDGPGPEHARWHSVVRGWAPGESLPEGAVVLVGFASDEGVRRNGGRVGAAAGPAALRQALASLSDPGCPAFDAGDVVVHLFRPEVREFYQLEKMWMPSGARV